MVGHSPTQTCDPSFSQCEEYGINVKDAKYVALIKKNNLKFSAIIAETLGGWNSKVHALFSFLARSLADRNSKCSFADEKLNIYRSLSASIQRSNARMILSRVYLLYSVLEFI